jgi:hypothetical protein
VSSTNTVPDISNIEILDYRKTNGDFDIASLSGVEKLMISDVATDGSSKSTYTVAADQTIAFDSVTDGDPSEEGAGSGEVEIDAADAVTSLSIELDSVGATGAGGDLDILPIGDKVETVNIESNGSNTNFAAIDDTTDNAVTTVNVTGDAFLDARESAISSSLETVTVSGAGGVFMDVAQSNVMTVTGGDGDDTFDFGGTLTTADTVDGGAGTDTLLVTTQDFDSSSVAKAVNGVDNFEVLGSTASGGSTDVDFKASRYEDINQFLLLTDDPTGSAVAKGPAAGGDAKATVALTGASNAETLVIQGAVGRTNDTITITGGSGGDASGGNNGDGGDGGDAIAFSPETDDGSNVATLVIGEGITVEASGGNAGLASGSGTGGDGGDALNASLIETLNITANGDLTVSGGGSTAKGGSASGADGGETVVGANATINIDGDGDVDLGTVSTSGNSNNFTVDASDSGGKLTVTTGSGNDTIAAGDGGSVITAGAGDNTLTGGAGTDTFIVSSGESDPATSYTTIKEFEVGEGGDVLDNADDNNAEGLNTLNATQQANVDNESTLVDAVDHIANTGDLGLSTSAEWVVFTYDGSTYALYDKAAGAADFTPGDDVFVELAGVQPADLVDSNFPTS